MIAPDFLKKGDRVAVVAPSFSISAEKVRRACEVMRSWGYEPVTGPNVYRDECPSDDGTDHYSGSVEERASELLSALESDKYKAIVCTRGGYGAIHLLDRIPLSAFRDRPKWIVGFSDITNLHAASVRAGVMSIHGNMCEAIGKDDGSCTALRGLLSGVVPEYCIAPNPYNVAGSAEGTLVGGNMITVAALFNTDFDMMACGGDVILFIEEVGENMHSIDRLFNMFLHQKSMENVRGIVFGEFAECPRDLPYGSVEQMLSGYVGKLGIPVCFGFPAGHGKHNEPLVEGARVRLDVSDSKTCLSLQL